MEELAKNIFAMMVILNEEINANVKKGNKAAGVRARKVSRELEKLLKEYRHESLKMIKKK